MLERFHHLKKEKHFEDFIGDYSAPEAEYMLLQNQLPGKELILRTSSERFCLGLSMKDSPSTVAHFRIDLCDSGSYRLRMHPDGRPGQDMEDYSLDTLLTKAIPLCMRKFPLQSIDPRNLNQSPGLGSPHGMVVPAGHSQMYPAGVHPMSPMAAYPGYQPQLHLPIQPIQSHPPSPQGQK